MGPPSSYMEVADAGSRVLPCSLVTRKDTSKKLMTFPSH